MFLFWIIIYALLMMVLPQLIRSIMSIIYSFPYYIKVIEKWLNSFVEHGWKLNPEMLDMINQYSAKAQEYLTTDILPQMQDMLKNVSAGIFDILIFMKNFSDRCHCSFVCTCRQREICCQKQNDGICYIAS